MNKPKFNTINLTKIIRRNYYRVPNEVEDHQRYQLGINRSKYQYEEFRNQQKLAQQYMNHRNKILKIIDENINEITPNVNVTQTFDDMTNQLGQLNYTNVDMRNTIMYICHCMIESVLVEMKLKNIQDDRVQLLIKDIQSSFNFNSIENFRFNFYNYKSSQYLNYLNSDDSKEIESSQYINFQSPEENNAEYLGKFETTLKIENHLVLGLRIVQNLLVCTKFTPTIEIFQYLIDQFGKLKLYNYQEIIYTSLLQYKHMPTVLSEPNLLMADHFTHLIEKQPEILSTLIEYQETRGDKRMVIELLSFLKLDKVAAETMVIKSKYLSKSNYRIPKDCPGIEFNDKKVKTVSRNRLYSIMESIINLELYEYLNVLINKIVLHSFDNNSIQLDYVEEKLVTGNLFDERLFNIILKASLDSNDLGRLLWVMPFLDEYVMNKEINKPSTELINQIINTLSHFKIEGKIKKYTNLL